MKISKIARADLTTLEPLLRASYGGGDFSITDEIDYFPNPAPKDWFWASDQGHAVGLLRHFAANPEISVAELYPPTPAIARALLEHFAAHHDLSEHQQLRFDLTSITRHLEAVIGDCCEITEIVDVHQFEKRIAPTPELRFEHQAVNDFQRVAEILSALKPFTTDQLEQFHSRQHLFVVHQHQTPVAATLIEPKTVDRLEVVALATDVNQRHRGHAQTLLRDLERYAAQHSSSIEFQVRDDNKPALRLYERAGYRANAARRVRWLYRRWMELGV